MTLNSLKLLHYYMCSSRKYPYSPHGRFLVLHAPSPSLASYFASKILAFRPPPPRNFHWPSMGCVWIFPGTTHWQLTCWAQILDRIGICMEMLVFKERGKPEPTTNSTHMMLSPGNEPERNTFLWGRGLVNSYMCDSSICWNCVL